MVEKKAYSEIGNFLLGQLAKKTMPSLRVLHRLGETDEEIEERKRNPVLGAQKNFKFLKEDVSPILSSLCSYINTPSKFFKPGLKVDFGLRPQFNPKLERHPKVMIYDGVKLAFYLPIGDREEDLLFPEEIKTAQDLDGRKGKKYRESIVRFGKLSKENLVSHVMSAVESLIPSEFTVSDQSVKSNLNSEPAVKFTPDSTRRSLVGSIKVILNHKKK
jgi:hypothetical protein